jgi:uncharacterized protein DUF4267
MQNLAKQGSFYLTLITGLLLIFIGSRFLIFPQAAEIAFGIHTPTGGDYSFQYIKGIRDLFAGASITVLLLLREYRALGFLLMLGGIIPIVDFMIVFSHPDHETAKLYPHLSAIIIVIITATYYIRSTNKK